MTEEEVALLYKNYSWFAGQIRGTLINEIVVLERMVDSYLCTYFCDKEQKRADLLNVVMATERITFESKRQILKVIMEKHDPKTVSDNPDIFKDIQYIGEQRNMLAHYLLYFTPDTEKLLKEQTFTLARFRNGVTYETFDKERGTRLITLINKYVKVFINLLEPHYPQK